MTLGRNGKEVFHWQFIRMRSKTGPQEYRGGKELEDGVGSEILRYCSNLRYLSR